MHALNSLWNSISPYFYPQAETPSTSNDQPTAADEASSDSSTSNALPTLQPEPEISETQDLDAETVDELESLQEEIDSLADDEKKEIGQHLHMLRVDAERYLSQKIKGTYDQVKATNQKQQELSELYRNIIAHMDQEAGHLNVSDDHEIHKHFIIGRKHGIKIPHNKTSFTKNEVDAIIKQVESLTQSLDSQFKLQNHEVSECIKQHDLVLQTIKKCSDQESDAIRKAIQGVRGA